MSLIAPIASITGSATIRRRTSGCIPATTSNAGDQCGTRQGSQTRSREWCEMVNSRAKGARGERELRDKFREYGFMDARRGQQYCGANGDADVVGLPGIHVECKRVERLNIEQALAQSQEDALESEVPAVFHRKDRGKWMVTMDFDDWMNMYMNQKDPG